MLRGRSSGGTAALLNKVSHQLKGEKVQEDEDDGLGAYLSSLGKKGNPTNSAGQPNWEKFGEEDLSISSDDGKPKTPKSPKFGSSNKFMKKKTTDEPASSKFIKKAKIDDKKVPTKDIPALSSKSSALSKASAFTNRYSGAAAASKKTEIIKFSDSELDDMSLSIDEDVMLALKPAARPATAPQQSKLTAPTTLKKPESPDVSEDSDLGKRGAGSKFLRSKPKDEPKPAKSLPQSKKKSSVEFKKEATPVKKSAQIAIDSDDDSFPLGKGGSKFLKKKVTVKEEIEEKVDIPTEDDLSEPAVEIQAKPLMKKKDMFSLRSAEKYSTTVMLDSDDESMKNFIHGLSPAASPRRSPQRSPSPPQSPSRVPKGILKTPRTPRTPTMEYISEEDESRVNSLKESLSEDESFKQSSSAASVISYDGVNVMDLDDLQPATEPTPAAKSAKTSKKKDNKKGKAKDSKKTAKKEDSDDLLSSFGLQTVDDLLGGAGDINDLEPVSEVITEIDEKYDSDFEPPSRSAPLRSILSPSPRPSTPKSGRSRVRLSLTDVREVWSRSRSPSPDIITSGRARTYSDDFDDDSIHTEVIKTETVHSEVIRTESIGSETEDYSERTISPSPRSSSSYIRRQKSEDYYSDDFTSDTFSPRRRWSRASSRDSLYSAYTESDSFSDASTDRTLTSPEPQRRKVKTKSAQIQTGLDLGDLVYHWSDGTPSAGFDLGATRDPTPLASHVVGAEALSALTSFSPSVLVLNDMLRSQLEMTRNFLNMQHDLHSTLRKTTYPDHQYTTLEDTRRYIKKHKKPTLTFDEALRQVKEDMGLS